MRLAIEKTFYMLKIVAYVGLGIMLYTNLIGPEGVAELLKVSNPSKEGLENVGVSLPKYVIQWTIATVALEVLVNIYGFVKYKKPNDRALTHGEFNDKERKRDTEQFETNLRIANIEDKLNSKKD